MRNCIGPATIGWFVEAVLNIVIEKNEKACVMSGGLFAAMVGVQNTNTIFKTPNGICHAPLPDRCPVLVPSGPLPLSESPKSPRVPFLPPTR